MRTPRRSPRSRPGARPGAKSGTRRPSRRSAPAAQQRTRSRLTGRTAILALVALVLVISYASSLRAWLQQREDLAEARAQIESSQQNIDDLEREKRRWNDSAYVEQQARKRFGWVMPGEVGYRVIGENGETLGPAADLDDEPVGMGKDAEWYERLWRSVESSSEESATNPEGPGPSKVIEPTRRDDPKDRSSR